MTTAAVPAKAISHRMLIGGDLVDSSTGDRFQRESPAHDVTIGDYPLGSIDDLERAVGAARIAFDEGEWPRASGAERAAALRCVAALIEDESAELAWIEALESGKPISQAREEVAATVQLWWYAATLSQHAVGDAISTLGADYLGLALREPVGVVGMIMPWNFPLLIASQKLPFALAVGCTAVLKPSELTPGTTLRLAELVHRAGIPAGVVNVVSGRGELGAHMAGHRGLDMISFTGSTEVGRSVAVAAAASFKRVSLELGGKNPMVVMADADLEAAADAAVFGFTFNQGECCNSASRLLVDAGIAPEFEQRIVELAKKVPIGDPLDDRTRIGAIASRDQLAKIETMVASGLAEGAELAVGGSQLETDTGRFFEATVFTDVDRGNPIAREEIFGPVLSVIRFNGLDDAIRLTNDTNFGLSAGIWTNDQANAWAYARAAQAGTVWVNCWMDGFPELSFGGRKHSGVGRELGRHAIEEFTELKTVTTRMSPREMRMPGEAGQ